MPRTAQIVSLPPRAKPAPFRFPSGDARTTVIGTTGSGKTTCGLWLLSHQRFERRPWIGFDFKREQAFDDVGFPPIRQIGLDATPPKKPGFYLVSPRPGEEDDIEAFLWRVWEAENIGLYIDELALMPDQSDSLRAIYQQGRSKRIPVIGCTQRPVSVLRAVFSEANFLAVYHLMDKRDYKVLEGFAPVDLSEPLPWHHWYWWDRERRSLLAMKPVPPPAVINANLSNRIPYRPTAWHPFGWTGRTSGRAALKAK